jgi:hypothetical protein
VGKGAWHEFASLHVLKMLAVSAIALGLMSGAVRAEGIMTYGLGRNACGEMAKHPANHSRSVGNL